MKETRDPQHVHMVGTPIVHRYALTTGQVGGNILKNI
jgi:hypothetical protein